MKVALIQMDLAWEQVEENHRRAERRLQEAAALGARLAILPEMFCCGFSMNAGRLAQPEGGESEHFLKETAEGLGMWILAGVPQLRGKEAVNNALLVSPTGVIHRYTKLHPFSFAGEHRHYGRGDTSVTWEVEGVCITPFICYDLRFPEEFRERADATHLYVVIANWPEARRLHWSTLLRARAIENLAYVVGVNRVGEGGGLRYTGDSAAIGPRGELLIGASEEEAVMVVEVDPARVSAVRAAFPALDDRRR